MFCARSRPTNEGNREQKSITKKLDEFHNQFVLLTMVQHKKKTQEENLCILLYVKITRTIVGRENAGSSPTNGWLPSLLSIEKYEFCKSYGGGVSSCMLQSLLHWFHFDRFIYATGITIQSFQFYKNFLYESMRLKNAENLRTG